MGSEWFFYETLVINYRVIIVVETVNLLNFLRILLFLDEFVVTEDTKDKEIQYQIYIVVYCA